MAHNFSAAVRLVTPENGGRRKRCAQSASATRPGCAEGCTSYS